MPTTEIAQNLHGGFSGSGGRMTAVLGKVNQLHVSRTALERARSILLQTATDEGADDSLDLKKIGQSPESMQPDRCSQIQIEKLLIASAQLDSCDRASTACKAEFLRLACSQGDTTSKESGHFLIPAIRSPEFCCFLVRFCEELHLCSTSSLHL